MNSFIRKSILVISTLFLVLGLSSNAFAKIKIIVVTHGQDASAFWSVAKKGVTDAKAQYANIADVQYRNPKEFDMVEMAQIIDNACASKPDGLVVSIPDADALGAAITACTEAGIPTISMNSGSQDREALGALLHVGQTEYEAGYGGGKYFKKQGVTKAACVNQEVGNVALDRRCEGFQDGLGSPVDVIAVTVDPTDAKNKIVAYLQKNPGTQAIMSLGQDAAVPTMDGIKEAGQEGKTKSATFDLSPEVLAAIRDGNMEYAIDQQQYLQGYLPVVILVLYNQYSLLPGVDVLTGPGFVTQSNAADVIKYASQGYR